MDRWARLLIVGFAGGCAQPRAPAIADDQGEPIRNHGEIASPDPEPRSIPAPAPRLLIDDPITLSALEADHALGFRALWGVGAIDPLPAITAQLRARLASDRAEDPERTGVGLRHVHRQFDVRWLDDPEARFELIAVVNRMDREVYAPEHRGETRLVYRLAYTKTQQGVTVDSRLPMTINVVFWQDGPDRRALQAGWQAPPGLAGAELAAWLRVEGRALAPDALGPGQLKSVEINVQTERWPSTIRPDLAGHAEYLLQVFRPGPDGWRPAPLENSPDLARLGRDPAARAELLAWLRAPAQREALDHGTLVVPERFLATAATSISPRGFARLSNRPWSQLLSPADFADYDFAGLTTIRSPAALLRRLDGLSCQGCHQSRSIAGFHLLGLERDPDKRIDALAVASSPHLSGELDRRAAWHAAVGVGADPSEARPLSEHERGRGRWGSRCGLGDPGFAEWTCADGLVCTALGDPELGTCLTPGPGLAGDPCELGEVRRHADHHRDRVVDRRLIACADGGVCDNRVGFPEGMCAFACGSAAAGPDSACGAIPNLRSFNDCLAARRPFADCIADTAHPAGMRRCSVDAACRDDYICARSGSDDGVCLPPYFLFQLRVDGHPT